MNYRDKFNKISSFAFLNSSSSDYLKAQAANFNEKSTNYSAKMEKLFEVIDADSLENFDTLVASNFSSHEVLLANGKIVNIGIGLSTLRDKIQNYIDNGEANTFDEAMDFALTDPMVGLGYLTDGTDVHYSFMEIMDDMKESYSSNVALNSVFETISTNIRDGHDDADYMNNALDRLLINSASNDATVHKYTSDFISMVSQPGYTAADMVKSLIAIYSNGFSTQNKQPFMSVALQNYQGASPFEAFFDIDIEWSDITSVLEANVLLVFKITDVMIRGLWWCIEQGWNWLTRGVRELIYPSAWKSISGTTNFLNIPVTQRKLSKAAFTLADNDIFGANDLCGIPFVPLKTDDFAGWGGDINKGNLVDIVNKIQDTGCLTIPLPFGKILLIDDGDYIDWIEYTCPAYHKDIVSGTKALDLFNSKMSNGVARMFVDLRGNQTSFWHCVPNGYYDKLISLFQETYTTSVNPDDPASNSIVGEALIFAQILNNAFTQSLTWKYPEEADISDFEFGSPYLSEYMSMSNIQANDLIGLMCPVCPYVSYLLPNGDQDNQIQWWRKFRKNTGVPIIDNYFDASAPSVTNNATALNLTYIGQFNVIDNQYSNTSYDMSTMNNEFLKYDCISAYFPLFFVASITRNNRWAKFEDQDILFVGYYYGTASSQVSGRLTIQDDSGNAVAWKTLFVITVLVVATVVVGKVAGAIITKVRMGGLTRLAAQNKALRCLSLCKEGSPNYVKWKNELARASKSYARWVALFGVPAGASTANSITNNNSAISTDIAKVISLLKN